MIVAGAGGHALEVFDILISVYSKRNILFFDDINKIAIFQDRFSVIKTYSAVQKEFKKDPNFILGIGGTSNRCYLYEKLSKMGGSLNHIRGFGSIISDYADCYSADIMNLCFVGSNTVIGRGTLINTGAQIHHEVEIGEFSEINPGAIILGKCKIGKFTSVGAGAKILPKVKIGENVIIGAGSVVTRDVHSNCEVVGVPGKIIKLI